MIDLHIHSNNSDGSDGVVEILKKANELKLDYISITDHDNCDAYDELKKKNVRKNFDGHIIKGIELKCSYQGRVIDVLGYNYNVKKMKKLLQTYYPNHIDKSEDYPTLSDCIKIIHQAKGIAFIAHPYIYNWVKDKKKFLSGIIKDYKIDGIECYYSKFSDEQIEYILNICNQNNLLKCGGSDYHGKNKPGINIAEGYGNMQIPNYIIDNWKDNTQKKRLFSKFI